MKGSHTQLVLFLIIFTSIGLITFILSSQATYPVSPPPPQRFKFIEPSPVPEQYPTDVLSVIVVVDHLDNDWWTCMLRIGHISRAMVTIGHQVTVATSRGGITPHWREFFDSLGIRMIDFRRTPARTMRNERFDIAMYSTFWWEFDSIYEKEMPNLRYASKSTKHVAIVDDVGWKSKYSTFKAHNQVVQMWAQKNVQRHRQVAVYNDADAVVTITDPDRLEILSELQDLLPTPSQDFQKKIHEVRYVSSDICNEQSSPHFEDRADALIYVGNGYNPTNIIGLEWMVNEVWPLIKQSYRLLVIGKGWSTRFSKDGVYLLGEKGDLTMYLNSAKLAITPSVAGTGLNTKSVSYLSCGIPVITTPRGLAGLHVMDDSAVISAESPKEFASKVDLIMNDKVLWTRMSQAAFTHAKQTFSMENVVEDMKVVLDSAMAWRHPRSYVSKFDTETPVEVRENADDVPIELESGEAVLYSEPLFGGQSWKISDEEYDLSNFKIGSFLLGPKSQITLVTHMTGVEENSKTFWRSVASLGRWANVERSIKVTSLS